MRTLLSTGKGFISGVAFTPSVTNEYDQFTREIRTEPLLTQRRLSPRVRIGRRVLDLERRVLIDPVDGAEERLAASEFDLLKIFAENPNRPLMRDWLLEVTAHREADAFDRAIDLRITRLRRKVEIDPGHPEAIRTVRGVGYMFVPPKN
jgi:DNA-binding response OmpR family regulator